MKYLLSVTFALSYLLLSAQPNAKHHRVKIDLRNTSIYKIAELGLETDHGVFAKDRHLVNDFSDHELTLLDENEIPYRIMIEDVGHHYAHQNEHDHSTVRSRNINGCNGQLASYAQRYATPENYEDGTMGGYFTYEEMLANLDAMVEKYPNLISAREPIENIKTHEDRDIYWLRLSDNPTMDEEEPEVLYTALHHAREPNSLSQMIFYLWYMLENYDTDAEVRYLIDNTEMYFIPCVNPDGYVFNQSSSPEGGGLWRKNRYDENGFVVGVDLNRNYGFEWAHDNQGSSPSSRSETYRGPEAFSEPESQAVRDFCDEHKFEICLNYHTFGNLLIHPWGYSDQATEEDATFKAMGEVMTRDNKATIGTGTETVGYVVNGDSDDWMYGETDSKPPIYSLTPEAGEGSFGFWPPQEEIDRINKSCVLQNLTTAHLVHNYAEYNEVNDSEFIEELDGVFTFEVAKYGLKSGDISMQFRVLSENADLDRDEFNMSMDHLQIEVVDIAYDLSDAVQSGEIVSLEISINNGLFTKRDTVNKRYLKGGLEVMKIEDGLNLDSWEAQGGSWGVTTEDFVSMPSSITDSPNAFYGDRLSSTLTSVDGISVPEGEFTLLKFNAKWDIELGFDYVQVQVSTDGIDFVPLCGDYTTFGLNTHVDAVGEPLYDGLQSDWVEESIDFTDYMGTDIMLRFELFSDDFVNLDGFYFDDIRFETVAMLNTSSDDIAVEQSGFTIRPNPSGQYFEITSIEFSDVSEVVIFDLAGRQVLTQVLDQSKVQIQHNLEVGLYLVALRTPSGTEVQKLVIH